MRKPFAFLSKRHAVPGETGRGGNLEGDGGRREDGRRVGVGDQGEGQGLEGERRSGGRAGT